MVDTKEEPRYQVRAVKLSKDRKTERFVPEIVIHDNLLKADQTFGDCKQFCHDKFVNAVLALNGHYAVLADYVEYDNIADVSLKDDEENPFRVRGFSLSGNMDELRVTLKGHKITKRCGGMIYNLNNIYLNKKVSETDEDDGYPGIEDLAKKIEKIKARALAYAFEFEAWAYPQLSLALDTPGATTLQIAPAVTPESVVTDLVNSVNGRPKPQSNELPDGKTPRTRTPRKTK